MLLYEIRMNWNIVDFDRNWWTVFAVNVFDENVSDDKYKQKAKYSCGKIYDCEL